MVRNVVNVMSNWLLLFLGVTLILLNIIDAALTRIGLRKGHQEKIWGTKALIRDYGLDRAMLVKVSVLTLVAIFAIILGWYNEIIGLIISITFIVLVIAYSCIVAHNCVVLWKNRH